MSSIIGRLLNLDNADEIDALATWAWQCANALPAWFWLLFGLAAAAAAALNLFASSGLPWRSRVFLFFVRLLGFGLLAVMLGQVEIRLELARRLPSAFALMVDASASMDVRDLDGGQPRRQAAQAAAETLAAALGSRCRLCRYDFGWHLAEASGQCQEGATRIAASLAEVIDRESDLQAIIILSDGNDTAGDRGRLVTPLLAQRGIPVYAVALGNHASPPRGEVRIGQASPYARLGDETVIAAVVSGNGLPEQTVRAALYEKGNPQPLAVKENVRLGQTPCRVVFVVKPQRPGERVYRIVLEGVKGSATERRLAAEHRLEVVDARIRVLYVDIPRDERKILGHWLARDPVMDLATLTMLPKGGWYGQGSLRHKDVAEGLPANEADLYQYDVIILGDIPRSYFRQGGDVSETKLRWLVEFVARRGGGLIHLGGRSVYGAGNYQDSALTEILPFAIDVAGDQQAARTFNILPTPLGLAHPIMQLESEPDANREAWLDLPTLDGCNRVGAIKPSALLLATRKMPEAEMPVLALQEVGKGKVLAAAFDTTWRWEMMRPPEGVDYFRRFWGNAVRYLAPDPRLQPEAPRISRAQARPAVGETVSLSTRLVDNLYQPIRNAEIAVRVASPSGRTFVISAR